MIWRGEDEQYRPPNNGSPVLFYSRGPWSPACRASVHGVGRRRSGILELVIARYRGHEIDDTLPNLGVLDPREGAVQVR